MNGTVTEDYDGGNMDYVRFFRSYSEIHGYVSTVICSFGITSNLLNIIILTRKRMSSSTSLILTSLAVADIVMMCTYLVYAIYFYIVSDPISTFYHTRGWMTYTLISTQVSITCHNMATWFTVALAVFQYISVARPVEAKQRCSRKRSKIAICAVIVATITACLPSYFLYEVEKQDTGSSWVRPTFFVEQHPEYQTFVFWIHGVVIKIVPCVLLTILITLIICTMQSAKRQRRLLSSVPNRSERQQSIAYTRTATMLIAVAIFSVLTGLPQGILALISGLNTEFFHDIYSNLGDIMDLLVLLNSAINFILYCIMSHQFRQTFKSLFYGRRSRSLYYTDSIQNCEYRSTTNTKWVSNM